MRAFFLSKLKFSYQNIKNTINLYDDKLSI